MYDQCQGTPTGLVVNSVGCADLDDDGVYENVDLCPMTTKKWTVDELGCTVLQLPVQWQVSSTLSGPMEVVPDFTVPTLGATFYFDDMWTGNDVYLFYFQMIASLL